MLNLTRTILTALTLLTTTVAATAQQQVCVERERVVERLAERYKEVPRAMGLGANNGVVEVFASHETGTWTITVTMPNGRTCLVASGHAWEFLEPTQPNTDEKL